MGIKGESDLEQRKEKSLFKDSLWNNENKEVMEIDLRAMAK